MRRDGGVGGGAGTRSPQHLFAWRKKPLVDALRLWLEAQRATVSGKSTIAAAIRHALSRWDGLARFLDDGRIEIDFNVVERSIRPRRSAARTISSPGPTAAANIGRSSPRSSRPAKINGIDPKAYLRDVLARIVARHPMERIDELLPFAYLPAGRESPENTAYDPPSSRVADQEIERGAPQSRT